MMDHVDRIAALLPAYDKQGGHLTATLLSVLSPALAAFATDLATRYSDLASPATVHLLSCAAATTDLCISSCPSSASPSTPTMPAVSMPGGRPPPCTSLAFKRVPTILSSTHPR